MTWLCMKVTAHTIIILHSPSLSLPDKFQSQLLHCQETCSRNHATDRQADGQTDGQADRQTDRQTDGWRGKERKKGGRQECREWQREDIKGGREVMRVLIFVIVITNI